MGIMDTKSNGNIITIVPTENAHKELKCPFRTHQINYQTNSPTPQVHQTAELMDCYYEKCPFYNKEGNSCDRADIEVGRIINYKTRK